MSIAYRDAVPADTEQLAALFKTVFCETFAHLYSAEDLATFLSEHDERLWREQLADPKFAIRLAEEGPALAGYSKLGPLRLPVDDGTNGLELRQLYVASPWHGSGIAAALMDWTIGEARSRGARHLYLSVYTENHRAQRFYRRYGFDEVGPYKFMVGSQADEDVIMRLAL